MTTADEFFAGGSGPRDDGVDRDRHGRYVLPDHDGEKTGWTRATTLAGTTDERYHLEQWERRLVALGMARRPDLVALAANATGADDKAVLADVVRQARDAAGGDSGAQTGTAWHVAVMRTLDSLAAGEVAAEVWERIPAMFRDDVAAVLACLEQHSLRPVPGMIERIVRVDDYHSAGQFDVICEWTAEPMAGERVVVDLKTQKDPTGLGSHSIAVQLAQYNHADALWNPDGNRYEPMPNRLRTDFALVLHLRPGSAQCLAYRVDTSMGWWAARLSAEVRAWRKMSHLVTPFVQPDGMPAAIRQDYRGGPIETVVLPSDRQVTGWVSDGAQVFTDPVGRRATVAPHPTKPHHVIYTDVSGIEWAVSTDVVFWEVDQPDDDDDPPLDKGIGCWPPVTDDQAPEVGGAGVPSEPVTPPAQPIDTPAPLLSPEAAAAELAKKTKAELQEMCRKRGIADLQRVRTKLAAYVVAHDRGLSEVGGVALPGAAPSVPPAPVSAEPTHPLTAARLRRVSEAQTMGDLGILHNDVSRAVAASAADPGWVPVLDDAAKARAVEIDAAGGKVEGLPATPVTTSSNDPAVVAQVEQGNAAAAVVVEREQSARAAAQADTHKEESAKSTALRMIEQAMSQGDLARVYEQWTDAYGMGAWDNELSDAGIAAQKRIEATYPTP